VDINDLRRDLIHLAIEHRLRGIKATDGQMVVEVAEPPVWEPFVYDAPDHGFVVDVRSLVA
jgi:hypothetical protein